MTSIRRFLVIVLLATIALSSFIAAIEGYRTGMDNTNRLFDEQLANMARLLAQTGINSTGTQVLPVIGDLAVQVFDGKRQLLYRSGNSPETAFTGFDAGYTYSNFAGLRWRSYTFLSPQTGQWVMVAERMDARYRISESIILETLLPIIISVPLTGILIWLIVGSGLKPLHQLAQQLSTRKASDLSPLSDDEPPQELAELQQSINRLLARLENSFNREKRFSGDAAHELRTPLSVLKVQVYNLQKQLPPDNENIQLINRSIHRMTHVIEQMLSLYRTSPEQFIARCTTLDVYPLAQEVISSQFENIDSKNQQIELTGMACDIEGDPFALQALLKNLVDNASKYTPPDGRINVDIQCRENDLLLRVDDSGPGIRPELRERVFERFYRVDGDMHQSSISGCGLGLTIVRHIVDLHQGNIALQSSPLGGLAVVITLPRQRSVS